MAGVVRAVTRAFARDAKLLDDGNGWSGSSMPGRSAAYIGAGMFAVHNAFDVRPPRSTFRAVTTATSRPPATTLTHDAPAWTRGYAAGERGTPGADCPFARGTTEAWSWSSGWIEGDANRQRECAEREAQRSNSP